MERSDYHIKKPADFFLEPEEIFLDAQKDPSQKIEEPVKKRNFILFYIFIGLVFFLFLGRTSWLQIVKGDFYQVLAEKNRTRIIPLFAPRGIIYDRTGKQLVYNIPSFDLMVRPAELPKKNDDLTALLERVSQILGVSADDFLKDLDEKKTTEKASPFSIEPLVVASDIEHEKVLVLETIIENLPGFFLEENQKRQYAFGPYLAHILGYVGSLDKKEIKNYPEYFFNERIGKAGLESEYQNVLRGQPGQKEIEVDTFGKEKKVIASSEGQAGQGLVLSLDSGLQNVLYDELNKTLAQNKLSAAAAVALNPQNGQILALVSLPSFDNNLLSQGISQEDYLNLSENSSQPFFNRAISGEYPAGSTIKPLIGAAALQEGIITPSQKINDTGDLIVTNQYDPKIVYRFTDWKVHGLIDIYQAIAESCNVFFYHLGGGSGNFEGLGLDRLIKYFRLFGLGNFLGIDLPNEKRGFVPTAEWKKEIKKEDWYIGDIYHLAIGQGDLAVTPLQMAVAIAAIANNGVLWRPQIVDKIIDSEKNTLKEFSPQAVRKIYEPLSNLAPSDSLRSAYIKKENLKVIQDAMRLTVIAGSAQSLNALPVKVAGKTGTAQVNGSKKPHAWFTSFAPYENPTIVLTILVENGGEGSAVAVPIAKNVLEWYFNK